MSPAESTGFDAKTGADPGESTASASFAAGPVLPLLAGAALAVSAVLLIPGGVIGHYAGYVCASVISFTAIAINRRAIVGTTARVDRASSRAGAVISAILLLIGFALAIGQAWFIARHYG